MAERGLHGRVSPDSGPWWSIWGKVWLSLNRVVALLIATLAVPACSQPLVFSKVGVSDAQQAHDRYACMQESRVGDVVGGQQDAVMFYGQNKLAQREANRLFEACMSARGYQKTSSR